MGTIATMHQTAISAAFDADIEFTYIAYRPVLLHVADVENWKDNAAWNREYSRLRKEFHTRPW